MAAVQPSMETRARVASEAASIFVDHYYDALNRRQSNNHNLAPFYASTSNKLTAAGVKPDISINGVVCESVADFETLLDKQGSPVHCGSEMNRAERKAVEAGDRISLAVQVSGTVRYGKAGEEGTTERAFNEAWLLVPHWEAWARNPPRGLRRWVVASQNFRAL